MLRYYIKTIIRFLLKIFFLFPVDSHSIFLDSFDGKELCCSPLSIYNALKKQENKGITFYISNCSSTKQNEKYIHYVKPNSLSWIIAQIKCGILITNTNFKAYIPYRKKQLLINTWHGGGAYKKVAISDNSNFMNKAILKNEKYINKYLTYFISSANKFTDVMKVSMSVDENKFLNIGLPRNDIFFNKEQMQKENNEIRKKYKISLDDFIVLFAPTYRGEMTNAHFESKLEINRLKENLTNITNKKVFFVYRGHYFVKGNLNATEINFDWSSEPNMQELLCAADMLITDYSSSMWDFSFTNKPCILFSPDIDEYISSRGFYTEPKTWGFPIAKNNDELEKVIKEFDYEKYKEDIEKSHRYFGSFETGTATEKICKIIQEHLK